VAEIDPAVYVDWVAQKYKVTVVGTTRIWLAVRDQMGLHETARLKGVNRQRGYGDSGTVDIPEGNATGDLSHDWCGDQ